MFAMFWQVQNAGTSAPHSAQEWLNIMPEINEALDAAFPGQRTQAQYPPALRHVGDLIGNGTSVALVSFGPGGAYTSQLALLRIVNGKPAVARFKDRTGNISSLVFAEGASVMHWAAVELLLSDHTLFSQHVNYNGDGTLHDCAGEAYRWNPVSERFDYHSGLSKTISKEKCSQVPKTLPRL